MSQKPKLYCQIFRDDTLVEVVQLTHFPAKVGAHEKAHLRLNDESVSRSHAVIEEDGGQYFLTDLGSGRGTLVNGQRITREELRHGDAVQVGQTKIVVLTRPPDRRAPVVVVRDEEVYAQRFLPKPAKTDGTLQIAILYRDFVLADESFRPPRTVVLGPQPEATYGLDASLVGERGLTLIDATTPDKPILCLPLTAPFELYHESSVFDAASAKASGLGQVSGDLLRVPLTPATRAHLLLGEVKVFVHMTTSPKAIPVGRYEGLVRDLVYLAISALLLGSFLLLAFLMPPKVSRFSMDAFDPNNRFVQLLLSEQMREQEELPEWLRQEEEEEEGDRQMDDEGRAGQEQQEEERDSRMAVEERREYTETELAEARDQVRDMGALAVLQDAPTNVFGSMATGMDDLMAMGMVTGDDIGSTYGNQGMGRFGVGLGQGGTGSRVGFGAGTFAIRGRSGDEPEAARALRRIDDAPVRQVAVVPAGPPDITGGLDMDIIRRVVNERRREIRACYEAELQRNPDIAGRVVFHFVITPDGAVAQASVRETTLNNEAVEQCVARRIRQWRFPEPRGGGIVRVDYPFNFGSTL